MEISKGGASALVLLLLSLGLLCASAVLIWLESSTYEEAVANYSHKEYAALRRALSRHEVERMTDFALSFSEEAMSAVASTAERVHPSSFIAPSLPQSMESVSDRAQLLEHLFFTVRLFPSVAWHYVALRGRVIGYVRASNGSLSVWEAAPPGNPLTSTMTPANPLTGATTAAPTSVDSSFNLEKRPWYVAAEAATYTGPSAPYSAEAYVWTAPYTFVGNEVPGITVARRLPLSGELFGVAAADIELSQLDIALATATGAPRAPPSTPPTPPTLTNPSSGSRRQTEDEDEDEGEGDALRVPGSEVRLVLDGDGNVLGASVPRVFGEPVVPLRKTAGPPKASSGGAASPPVVSPLHISRLNHPFVRALVLDADFIRELLAEAVDGNTVQRPLPPHVMAGMSIQAGSEVVVTAAAVELTARGQPWVVVYVSEMLGPAEALPVLHTRTVLSKVIAGLLFAGALISLLALLSAATACCMPDPVIKRIAVPLPAQPGLYPHTPMSDWRDRL